MATSSDREMVQRVLREVSHELRTPLHVVRRFIEESEGRLRPEVEPRRVLAETSALRMLEIVEVLSGLDAPHGHPELGRTLRQRIEEILTDAR